MPARPSSSSRAGPSGQCAAIAANPADSRAPYYLGNLLFDHQPDRAIALWEKSAALGADFPVVYRNLAMVYARQQGGNVVFYKDGYTDLRGRFDYVTLSTDDLDRVERFAILVVSDDAGATVLEAAPPPR